MKLHGTDLENDVIYMTSRPQQKEKKSRVGLHYIKLKSFCTAKDLQDENAIYGMEEKFYNHILNEGLRSRIYTQLIQQNSMKEWADKQNRHFRKKISK